MEALIIQQHLPEKRRRTPSTRLIMASITKSVLCFDLIGLISFQVRAAQARGLPRRLCQNCIITHDIQFFLEPLEIEL